MRRYRDHCADFTQRRNSSYFLITISSAQSLSAVGRSQRKTGHLRGFANSLRLGVKSWWLGVKSPYFLYVK